MLNKGLLITTGLVAGTAIFAGSLHGAFAAVSSYNANQFSQYCSQNSSICKKVDFNDVRTGSVSCPIANQTVSTIYVHAGDGQTVYQLPQTGFSYTFSNNNNTANVVVTTHQHDISWIGVVCSNATATASTTPTNSPTVTPTATPVVTASPSATPTNSPSSSPTASATPTSSPTASATPTSTASSSPTASVTPTVTPTTTPNNGIGGSSNSSNNSTTSDPGQVLGTSTLAATGTFAQSFANILLGVGASLMAIPTALYAKTKKASKK